MNTSQGGGQEQARGGPMGMLRRMSPRARRIAVALVAAILLVAVLWNLAVRRKDSGSRSAKAGGMAGTDAGGSMDGMAGMSTTETGSVKLTSSQIRQFGITFGTAEVRPLTTEVRTSGVVTFNETKIAQVAPRFGGFVERLYVDFTGKPVRRGDPLLEIYSPELVAAQEELLISGQLQRDIGTSSVPGVPAGSTTLVDAARRRLRLWDISEEQITEIVRTGRVRRTLTLYAPVSGVVVEKKVVQGQATMPGEPLYTIADLSNVWVEAELRESDAAVVRVGSAADIEFAGLAGRPFNGRVEYVYPMLQQEARTVKARVAVANPGGVLKPGMYATVRLTIPGRSTLTVPSTAVLRTGDRNVVFVDMRNGELMPHEVELGRVAGDYTEILSGLENGLRVVTSAQFLLDSESNLGEVMKAMMGNMGSGDAGNMKGMKMPAKDEGADKGADMKNMPGMKMPPDRR